MPARFGGSWLCAWQKTGTFAYADRRPQCLRMLAGPRAELIAIHGHAYAGPDIIGPIKRSLAVAPTQSLFTSSNAPLRLLTIRAK